MNKPKNFTNILNRIFKKHKHPKRRPSTSKTMQQYESEAYMAFLNGIIKQEECNRIICANLIEYNRQRIMSQDPLTDTENNIKNKGETK